MIGVGINITNHFSEAPDEVRARAISLVEFATTSRQAVLAAFLEAFDERLSQIATGDASLIEAAREACVLTGKIVMLRDGERLVTGTCLGVANNGSLLLENSVGERSEHRSGVAVTF